jgi:hypothetical protein
LFNLKKRKDEKRKETVVPLFEKCRTIVSYCPAGSDSF